LRRDARWYELPRPADAQVRAALDAIADPDARDRLAERLLTVASWHKLLGVS